MRLAEFTRYLNRDGGCYCGCGYRESLVPNHRANRGMGGSKLLDRPSNVITLCAHMNGLIESDATLAQVARKYGWKLERWQSPEETPVYDRGTGQWFLLANDYTRKAVQE